MIGFPSQVKILVALNPVDMRKSFNGLATLAETLKSTGLHNGAIFIFTNKRRNRLKALYYDRTGVCILAKKLELGTFSWPKCSSSGQHLTDLSPEALQLLIDGIDLHAATMKPWYERS